MLASSRRSAVRRVTGDGLGRRVCALLPPMNRQSHEAGLDGLPDHERILCDLRDIRLRIEEGLRPTAKSARRSEIQRLLQSLEQQKDRLRECLDALDRHIGDSRKLFVTYDETRAELIAANERLGGLGARPLSLPDFPSAAKLRAMVAERIRGAAPRAKP